MASSSTSPIILIDDDQDDAFFISKTLKEIAPDRPVLIFFDAESVLTHLRTVEQKPFLILSEIVLPGLNGLELRQQIEGDPILKKRSIPFILWQTLLSIVRSTKRMI